MVMRSPRDDRSGRHYKERPDLDDDALDDLTEKELLLELFREVRLIRWIIVGVIVVSLVMGFLWGWAIVDAAGESGL